MDGQLQELFECGLEEIQPETLQEMETLLSWVTRTQSHRQEQTYEIWEKFWA